VDVEHWDSISYRDVKCVGNVKFDVNVNIIQWRNLDLDVNTIHLTINYVPNAIYTMNSIRGKNLYCTVISSNEWNIATIFCGDKML